MKKILLTLSIVASLAVVTDAQQRFRLRLSVAPSQEAGQVIDPLRVSQLWSSAGATVDLTRPRCTTGTGVNVLSTSATYSDINTAISGCDAGHAVELSSGTFNLTSGITFGKDNVTLRGQGPNSTFLRFTDTCNVTGDSSAFCIQPASGIVNYNDNPHNICDWTAGYTRGTVDITIDATDCTGGVHDINQLTAGKLLILDQEDDDPGTPYDGWWVSGGSGWGGVVCQTTGCSRGQTRTGRPQIYFSKVESVSGSGSTRTVRLAEPLVHTNWTSGKNPQVWFNGYDSTPVTGFAIENMSIDCSPLGTRVSCIGVYNGYGGWFTNNRFIMAASPTQAMMYLKLSAKITVRGNYFYGKSGANGNYGIAPFAASNILVENNIGECNETTITDNTTSSVFAYNFFANNCYVNPNWQQPGHSFHSVANAYVLMEGNDSIMVEYDQIHGPAYFMTGFRNRWRGWENGKHLYLIIPFLNMAWSRYQNMVGNVLGMDGVHVKYQTDSASGVDTDCNKSIYSTGWGNNCSTGGSGGNPPDDARVGATLMRWGNYDTHYDTDRWESSEVPSGDAFFPNAVPANHVLPESLYLSEAPPWWPMGVPWPPIGPDVTGGSEANVGGHVFDIPAKVCHDSLVIDTNYAETFAVTAASAAADATVPYMVTITTDRTLTTTFSGTPTTTSGTVPAATGWAIGQHLRIIAQEFGSQGAFWRTISNITGSGPYTVTWTPALPNAPASGGAVFFLQDGDQFYISNMTPTTYKGDRGGDLLVYGVSGQTFTYGLLTDPGKATVLGQVQSPAVKQFTGCAYQP